MPVLTELPKPASRRRYKSGSALGIGIAKVMPRDKKQKRTGTNACPTELPKPASRRRYKSGSAVGIGIAKVMPRDKKQKGQARMPVPQNCQSRRVAGATKALHQQVSTSSGTPPWGGSSKSTTYGEDLQTFVANKRAYSQVRQDQQLTAPSYWLSALSYWLSSSSGDESPG